MAEAQQADGDRHQRNVTDVLRELSMDAGDTFFDCLRATGSLRACRLASRAFRTALDGSRRDVELVVRESDRRRWEEGKLPLLSRWPRLAHVHVSVEDDDEDSDPEDLGGDDFAVGAAVLLSLPFVGLPLENRRRITRLKCWCDEVHWCPEVALSALLPRLPGLTELELHGLDGMSAGGRLQQQQMFESIAAALPNLQRLTLPGVGSLMHVGTLAGAGSGLRHLEVVEYDNTSGDEGALLDPEGLLSVLGRLESLRELRLAAVNLHQGGHGARAGDPYAVLRRLLDAVAATAIRRLQLEHCWVALATEQFTISADICLEAGSIVSIDLLDCDDAVTGPVSACTLPALCGLAKQALLPCRAVGRKLRRLCLARLVVVEDPAARTEREMLPLRALLRRGGGGDGSDEVEVEVGVLHLERTASKVAAAHVMEELGGRAVVRQLTVDVMYGDWSIEDQQLRFNLPPAAEKERSGGACDGIGSSSQAGAGPPAGRAALPGAAVLGTPQEAVKEALRRMVAAGPQPDLNQASPSGRVDAHGLLPMLLLRGPAVAVLTQAPAALAAWVPHLAKRSAAAASSIGVCGLPDAGGGAAAGDVPAAKGDAAVVPYTRSYIVSYMAMFGCGLVLVTCGGAPHAAAAVMAAVQAIAKDEAEGAVEAVPLGATRRPRRSVVALGVEAAFLDTLQQVLQELCDNGALGLGASGGRRLLDWVMALRVLPPLTKLKVPTRTPVLATH